MLTLYNRNVDTGCLANRSDDKKIQDSRLLKIRLCFRLGPSLVVIAAFLTAEFLAVAAIVISIASVALVVLFLGWLKFFPVLGHWQVKVPKIYWRRYLLLYTLTSGWLLVNMSCFTVFLHHDNR